MASVNLLDADNDGDVPDTYIARFIDRLDVIQYKTLQPLSRDMTSVQTRLKEQDQTIMQLQRTVRQHTQHFISMGAEAEPYPNVFAGLDAVETAPSSVVIGTAEQYSIGTPAANEIKTLHDKCDGIDLELGKAIAMNMALMERTDAIEQTIGRPIRRSRQISL